MPELSSTRRRLLAVGVLLALGWVAAGVKAQDRGAMVRGLLERDMPELLEVYLEDSLPAVRILAARAWGQHAVRQKDPARRQRAFARAEAIYEACISAKGSPGQDPQVHELHLLVAGVEWAEMIFRQQATEELDEFEITCGLGGNRDRLVEWLSRAVRLYRKARDQLRPLDQAIAADEERWLILGLYDAVEQTRDRLAGSLPWAQLYLALALPADDPQTDALLSEADANFAELLANPPPDTAPARVRLGLGMVRRAQGEERTARRYFNEALQDAESPSVRLRAELGLAQLEMDSGQFERARQRLGRLIEQGQQWPDDQKPSFYLCMAELLEARSYLLEADALTARDQRPRWAGELRAAGMALFERLAERAAPWPRLARTYVLAHIPKDAELRDLADTELWLIGTQAMEEGRFEHAGQAFELLVQRGEQGQSKFSARALYNLAVCAFQLGQPRAAGEYFERYAEQHHHEPLAPKAAYLAYRCYHDLASQSGAASDYQAAAEWAAKVLARFQDHPQQGELRRALPALYEQAGLFNEALTLYRKARPSDEDYLVLRHAEALCGLRLLAEKQRAAPGAPDTRNLARRVAKQLREFAELAEDASPPPELTAETLHNWALEAIVLAAEVYCSQDLADYQQVLDLLEQADEALLGVPTLRGRALASRIRAYRRLGQFDQATAVIREFVNAAHTKQVGRVLIDLVQAVEAQVEELRWQDRPQQARALAEDGVQTAVELLRWFEAQPQRADQVLLVEATLAKMLVYAHRPSEAEPILAKHLSEDPQNGELVRLRALACEQRATTAEPQAQVQFREQAETCWSQLLADASLRQNAPRYYWEAFEHWLALRLQAGHAQQVVKRVQQEQLWFPSLGGEPFKRRILALLQEAEQGSASTQPSDSAP